MIYVNAFVDTNVPIAYTFLIDPFNYKSISVFKKYKNIYWSKCVKTEFNKLFRKKRTILIKFYKGLLLDLKKEESNTYSFANLKKYLNSKNFSKYEYDKIESSLNNFWNNYVNDRWPTLENMASSIEACLIDLNISIRTRRKDWEDNIKPTPERTESYGSLHSKLNSFNVHNPDDIIILDAHDFNLNSTFALDFITFDKGCCRGASEINDFSFNAVKCMGDFL